MTVNGVFTAFEARFMVVRNRPHQYLIYTP